MRIRTELGILLGVMAITGSARAQTNPGDVTFEVPLNLTQLARDITQVDVTCSITSDAIPSTRMRQGKLAGHVVLPVTNGRVVTTANIVVAVSPDALVEPIGKTANYECILTGYSSGVRDGRTTVVAAGWYLFDENSAKASFRLSPTPQPLTGSFTWLSH